MTGHYDQPLLILRPEPGATQTAQRAQARGWQVANVPIFKVVPRNWVAPDPDNFEAIAFTSANACRHGGPQLNRFTHLPAYCVGKATADAARNANFGTVTSGSGDARALAELLRTDSIRRVLHLAGEDVREWDDIDIALTRIAVYASEPVLPPDLDEYLCNPVIVLIHSARAGEHFAKLVEKCAADRALIRIAAISPAALSEMGGGWRKAMVAAKPSDDALLNAAEMLARA